MVSSSFPFGVPDRAKPSVTFVPSILMLEGVVEDNVAVVALPANAPVTSPVTLPVIAPSTVNAP